MTTVTISVPETVKEFMEAQTEAKGYRDPSEYLLALLREAEAREADTRLEGLLLEGLDSGEDIQVTPEFWEQLKTEAAGHLPARKQP